MGTNKFNYKIALPITNVDLFVSHELRINEAIKWETDYIYSDTQNKDLIIFLNDHINS